MADASPRVRPDQDIAERVQRNMARILVAARWIMAPIYLGLLGGLVLVAVKFVQKLVLAVPQLLLMDTNETILTELVLIDLSLVGNLLVIVMFSGWENFVGPLLAGAGARGLQGLDFSAVKQKLFGSMAAIAGVQVLETFVHINQVPKDDAMWQLAILLGIAFTGVLLSLADRLSES